MTTLTAPDTSGTWACGVPNTAVWTVSLDSGFCESVEITQIGEEKTIDKWYLYDNGDEHISLTGGFVMLSGSDATIVNENGNLTIQAGSTGSHFGCNSIQGDLIKHFNKICIKTTNVSGSSKEARIKEQNNSKSTTLASCTLASNTTNKIDISSVTNGYLTLVAYQSTYTITEIWLEV